MAYRMKCNRCSHIFTAQSCRDVCPRVHCSSSWTSVLADVAETAVEVGLAYMAADVITDVAGAVLTSIFDWD